jgi:hypothetical protein
MGFGLVLYCVGLPLVLLGGSYYLLTSAESASSSVLTDFSNLYPCSWSGKNQSTQSCLLYWLFDKFGLDATYLTLHTTFGINIRFTRIPCFAQ